MTLIQHVERLDGELSADIGQLPPAEPNPLVSWLVTLSQQPADTFGDPTNPKNAPRTVRAPAEFSMLRQGCGLGFREAAEYFDCTLRAVQGWERGDRLPPQRATNMLLALDKQIRELADQVLAPFLVPAEFHPRANLIAYRTQEHYVGSPPHQAGLPHGAHSALLLRIIEGLTRLNAQFAVHWGQGGNV